MKRQAALDRMQFIKHKSSLVPENAFDIMYDPNFESIDKYEGTIDY